MGQDSLQNGETGKSHRCQVAVSENHVSLSSLGKAVSKAEAIDSWTAACLIIAGSNDRIVIKILAYVGTDDLSCNTISRDKVLVSSVS